MNWQSRNPLRTRDHRIALMPIEAAPVLDMGRALRVALLAFVPAIGLGWAIYTVLPS